MAVRELVSRRAASLLAAVGLLTATLGFVILATTSQTTTSVLTGDIGRAWNTPYDILVRPHGAANQLEQSQGVIRPNFLGGLYGGITQRQLDTIRGIDGVDVAAPVAVAGATSMYAIRRYDLSSWMRDSTFTGFRLLQQATGDGGMTTYPPLVTYVLAAPSGQLQRDGTTLASRLVAGGRSIECGSPLRQTLLACWANLGVCGSITSCVSQTGADHLFEIAAFIRLPLVIAGIDPDAEAKLAGLDRCVTSGRYLNESDRVTPGDRSLTTPMLFSEHTFVDEQLHVQVARAANPEVADTQNPFPTAAWATFIDQTVTADSLYQAYLSSANGIVPSFSNTWTQGDVSYEGSGDHVSAIARPPNVEVFVNSAVGGFSGSQTDPNLLVPPEAKDVWFRPVTVHPYTTQTAAPPALNAIGRYDPACLAGFNELAGGRLETYSPAAVQLPNGGLLKPTASVGGYINMPPTALTNLNGIQPFTDPKRFSGAPGTAFISVIRVRVAGTEQPGQAAQGRLSRVAAEIDAATGLQVDIVKGASPRSVQVDLPAGSFGRPALTVTEPWSVKGVGFRFLQAVSFQNLIMFSMVLLARVHQDFGSEAAF